MNPRLLLAESLACAACLGLPAGAGISVRFDAPLYEVGPGDEFVAGILIDGDDTTPGNQAVIHGLFSYGLRMIYDPAHLKTGAGQVDVVAPLDYTGYVPGARVEAGEGQILSQGNISLASAIATPYAGSALLAVAVRNVAPPGTRYVLSLQSARTNPTQTMFVNGLGMPLDQDIVFGTAEVQVAATPAPTTPQLTIRRSGPDTIQISYEVQEGNDHFLELSPDLATWTDLAPDPDNSGTITLPVSEAARFFRLRKVPIP